MRSPPEPGVRLLVFRARLEEGGGSGAVQVAERAALVLAQLARARQPPVEQKVFRSATIRGEEAVLWNLRAWGFERDALVSCVAPPLIAHCVCSQREALQPGLYISSLSRRWPQTNRGGVS